MERNYGAEIDQLANAIAEIKQLLTPQEENDQSERRERRTPTLSEQERARRLFEQLEESGDVGRISYNGVAMLSERGSYWGRNDVSLKELMKIPAERVSNVLDSLGNRQRWEILCALLNQPMTVAQLVEKFEMKTSGKAYHHLNGLLAADLLEEVKGNLVEKGTYAVKSHRVQGIVMILAGVADLLNTKYSNGEWYE